MSDLVRNKNSLRSAGIGEIIHEETENENDLTLGEVIECADGSVGAEVLLVNADAEFGMDTEAIGIALSKEGTTEEIETTKDIETAEDIESAEDVADDESTEDIEEAIKSVQKQNSGGVGLRGQPVYIGKRRDRSRLFCKKCGRAYYHRSSLSRHMRHECETVTCFVCPICSVKVKHMHTLKKHLHFKHPGYKLQNQKIQEV
ncbi:unnamed protein product [Callosobruchus maculatus]|uniref:C2H2-type domain-containing protein n=1 Tax=Callosobruchus maculatus TaxID=64391 RepID=A0A653DLR8_CALMS|nr:unnamed protein product [Callosobruchus maculatus]